MKQPYLSLLILAIGMLVGAGIQMNWDKHRTQQIEYVLLKQ
jgi:hypothetical protein